MTDLFNRNNHHEMTWVPLADRMRPRHIDEILGQEKILGNGRFLRKAIENDKIPSMILWGPPGTGKTTLAMILAKNSNSEFKSYSAVTSGIKELKEVLAQAKELMKFQQRRTILFIDEIHRFNKAQQDAFLPFVEQGDIILVGATTENPSFEINAALLSRCQVFVLQSIAEEQLSDILKKALKTSVRGLAEYDLEIDDAALYHLVKKAHGDARFALNALEQAAILAKEVKSPLISLSIAEEAIQHKALRYDKKGDEHFNIISALHKSIRGSDPDAAMYWLARMLEAGEDPRYLLRRMARMASEDIGLADPRALQMAVSAQQAFEFIGLPEGKLVLAELAVYLSLAPKSNALETGYMNVQKIIHLEGELDVPLHIRNAPTKFMRSLGYGKDYQYAHNFEGHWVNDEYLPESLWERRFYVPGILGWEGRLKDIIEERLAKRRDNRQNKKKTNQKINKKIVKKMQK